MTLKTILPEVSGEDSGYRRKPQTQAPAVKAPPARRIGADSILLDDVLTVKALSSRAGPNRLRKLIDGLADRRP